MKINGQNISSDQTFRSYVNNIEDISIGTKTYNTPQEMEEETKIKEDDLALVYNINENSIEDLTTSYSNLWLPKIAPNPYEDVGVLFNKISSGFTKYSFMYCEDTTYNLYISITRSTSPYSMQITIYFKDRTYVYTYDNSKNYFVLNTVSGVYLSETANYHYYVNQPDSSVSQAVIEGITVTRQIIKYGAVDFTGLYQFSNISNDWESAPTQYLAEDDDVMAVSYYGVNGGSVGTLNAVKYYNDANFNNITKYINKYSNLFNTLDTTNLVSLMSVKGVLNTLTEINFLNVQNANNFYNVFYGMNNLYRLSNVSNWNTTNVTNMSQMFLNCRNLVTIDNMANWDTSNVTNMAGMFTNCEVLNLGYDDLKNWNTTNVISMSNMFRGCRTLWYNMRCLAVVYMLI